jgi:RNA methyltransferase, TrmH family
MEGAEVTSPFNPLVKRLVRLRERRAREREGVFVVEGARELSRAVQAGFELSLLASCRESLSEDAAAVLPELLRGAREHRTFASRAFARASLRQHPDGVLGVVVARNPGVDDVDWHAEALYLVVAGIEKPGNLGALLRSADAAGATAVFVTGAGTDLGNPNVVRTSMGSLFTRPVVAVEDELLLETLRRRGVRVVATSPEAPVDLWDADLAPPVAVVVGPEHEGLDANWLDGAAVRVRVPMAGAADSLNVATAGALVLFEAVRQRRIRTGSAPRP